MTTLPLERRGAFWRGRFVSAVAALRAAIGGSAWAKRILVVACVAGCVLWGSWRGYRLSVGSPVEALRAPWGQSSRVLARDGRLLGERASAQGLYGRRLPLAEVGPRITLATIASEDKNFYRHDGVDRGALVRALATDVRHLRIVSGGSTITAQLVKRIDFEGKPRPRSLGGKLREAARAQNLDDRVAKDEILEAYLNRLDYGRGLLGPEAASLGYFGVHAKDASLAQAALIAVLPRAPSALDPYRHEGRAVVRQRALLGRMAADGLISSEDFARALAEPLRFEDPKRVRALVAPHLVIGARSQGGETRTTLDFDLQKDAEGIVRAHALRVRARGAENAAVVVVDNSTGEILVEVGSIDYFEGKRGGAIDLAHTRRQAGSTLKPFVYGSAFDRGLSPMDVLADVPTTFGAENEGYAPDNFDGTFLGPVSAREALAGSLNVPAVALAERVGVGHLVTLLERAGLVLPGGKERYGLSLALGSAEVTPIELAEAYTTLARGGDHLRLTDRAKAPLAGGAPPAKDVVWSEASSALVADALADPLARLRGLRARGPFEFDYPVAVKTGTSSAYRDAWTVGFTRERTVVVWVGNADRTPTSRLTGAVGAGPIFFDVMKRAMRDVTVHAPLVPSDLVEVAEVCPLSGKRAGTGCKDHVARKFARDRAPTEPCEFHAHASPRLAPKGEPGWQCAPEGASSGTIVVLPPAFDAWVAAKPLGVPGLDPRGLPWFSAARVPGCGGATSGPSRLTLTEPRNGATFVASRGRGAAADAIDVAVHAEGLPPREAIDVVVDGRLALRLAAPYRGRVPIVPGDHLIEVRPSDSHREAMLDRVTVQMR